MYTQKPFTALCRAALGPMTAAVKAQRTLLTQGIVAEVVALEPHETRRGCAYGVEFSCQVESSVRAALRAARITVSEYFKKG